MSDDTTILTRRRVLGGIAAVGIGSAAAGAGTMAVFSGTEESTGNVVTAGELTLDPAGSSGSSFNISVDDLVPDDSGVQVGYLDLENTGDVAGNLKYEITDWTDYENGRNEEEQAAGDTTGGNPGAGKGELSNVLEIDAYLDRSPGNGDRDNDAHITSGWVKLSSGVVQTGQTISAGEEVRIWVDARIPSGTGNEVQTDSVEVDATFILEQA